MLRVTDVVKNLLIINVLMYFGTILLMGNPDRYMLAMFYPTSDFFEPYQIISHMFMHGSVGHLFFNMFAVFMFGPPLENLWGPKRFLFFYLFTGFGALLLHMFVKYLELNHMGANPDMINVPVLGASGAVFGILVGFGMNFPNTKLMLIFPPIPIKAVPLC